MRHIRIVVIGTERGDTILNRSYPYTPVPMPKAVADSIRTKLAATMGKDRPPMKAYVENTMPLSKVYPPFASMKLGLDGYLWLKEFGAPGATTQRWRVLDPKGNEFGVVQLPVMLSVKEVTRDLVWGLLVDSEGSETLARYRLKPSDR